MSKSYSSKKKIYNRRIFIYADGWIICHIKNDRKKNKLLRKHTKIYYSV